MDSKEVRALKLWEKVEVEEAPFRTSVIKVPGGYVMRSMRAENIAITFIPTLEVIKVEVPNE